MAEGIGQLGKHLIGIRRCLLSMFQAWFAEQEEFPSLTYNQTDLQQSKLFIGDQFGQELEQSDWRPALITSRGDFHWGVTGLTDDMVAHDLAMDIIDYTRLYTGSIIIHSIAAEGLEAEQLACIVNDLLLVYWGQIGARVPLFDLSGIIIGAEQPFELDGAETDWVDVPVNVGLKIQYNYRVELPGTILTEVGQHIAAS